LFYGYANGDILFDETLLTTLLEIFDDVERYSELLITGVRTDCFLDVDPDCDDAILKSPGSTTQHDGLRTTGAMLVLSWASFHFIHSHIRLSISPNW